MRRLLHRPAPPGRASALLSLLSLFAILALCACAAAPSGGMGRVEPSSFQPAPQTSLGGQTVVGLFNDRNPRTPGSTTLRLDNLPQGKPVALSFTLWLVGTWDDEGQPQADTWALSANGRRIVELRRFGVKAMGSQRIGNHDLEYGPMPMRVVLSPEDAPGGRATLTFQGFLTGRGTEFWALSDVRVEPAAPGER